MGFKLVNAQNLDYSGVKLGKLLRKDPSPGKLYFIRFSTDAIRNFNRQRDENGVSYAHKEMIRTGWH